MKEPLSDKSPVIAVIGPSRCGKDTVARMLRQKLSLNYLGSVSWWCKEYVASLLGLPVQEAWETRNDGDNGALWGRLIDQRRVGDPGCILREMLDADAQIIPGIRKRAEFAAVRDRFTHVIWVERPGLPVDKTLDLTQADCDVVIANTGDLGHLEQQVADFIYGCCAERGKVETGVRSKESEVGDIGQGSNLSALHRAVALARQAIDPRTMAIAATAFDLSDWPLLNEREVFELLGELAPRTTRDMGSAWHENVSDLILGSLKGHVSYVGFSRSSSVRQIAEKLGGPSVRLSVAELVVLAEKLLIRLEPPLVQPAAAAAPAEPAPPAPPTGPWIQTVSGKRFYLLDPRPEMICLEDIAHALGQLCRFTGHTRQFLSVAEHSVTVSHLLKPFGPAAELAGLLHDAAEAYIGDVNNPLKVALRSLRTATPPAAEEKSDLDTIERRIKDVLAVKFDVDFHAWKEVGQVADLLALKYEADHLCGGTKDWSLPAYTQWHGATIVVEKADKYCWFSGLNFRYLPDCYAPAEASRKFLERFAELSQLK